MKPKSATIKAIASLLAAAALDAALPAQASTITVGGSGNNFTITRTGDTSAAETVHYRTVPLSAFPGQHYTEKSGTLVFAPGQTGTNITVSAASMSNDAYRFQTDASRTYRFEILDEGGFPITNATRDVSTGLRQFKADKVSKSVTDLVTFSGGSFSSGMASSKYLDVSYTPPSGDVQGSGKTLEGYVLIDDSYDYAQKPATVSTATLIDSTGATASYLNSLGYKIHATVCFYEKEKDDGYQYLQIVAGTASASYDTGADPNGAVKDPTNSVYKVCFELADGSNAEGKAYFPHRGTNTTEFSLSTGKLWQQKYKDGYAAGSSGSVVLPVTTSYITTRFDAGGDNDDTWGYKDLFVRMALVDDTYPTLFNNSSAAIRVDPGPHCKGNAFYISVPFNEIVYASGTKTISTTWGDAVYHSGDGSNVITFKGTITASAGTVLKITGGTCNFRDLSYNYFQGSQESLSKTFNGKTVSASHAYPITYDLGGGTLPANAPTSYTYDAEATLVQPTRAGYTFDGWTGSNGSTPQKNVHISIWSHGRRSYMANWSIVTYTNTYDLAGGALPEGESNPETYTVTNATFSLVNPIRTGYTFTGWTGTDLDGPTNEVTVATGSTGDRSYVATWTANTYSVRFNDNDGSSEPRYQEFSYDQQQSLDPAIARTGYDFAGWCTNEDVTVIFANCAVVSNLTAEADGVVDLYARWVGHSYIVRFDGNAADAVGNTDEMGMTYDVPDNLTSNGFTRTGYDFAGWSTSANGAVVYADGASVSNLTAENHGSVTLYAQWTAHTYTIRFDANGGEGSMSDQLFTYDVATNLEANAFSRIGYDFAGWSTSENGAVVYADGASVSNLTAENHGSVTLYAQWTAHTYTVHFDANGGDGTMSDQVFTYDVVTNLDANVFTRTGYDFAGWSTSANGAVVYADGASVSNLTAEKCGSVTLYAQWTLHTYSVHFDANGGEGEMSDQVFTYDVVTNLPANVFSRTGYDFAGWGTSANGSVVYADGASVSNLTAEAGGIVDLYAQWTAHTYTVRFDRNAADATGEMADMQFTYDAPQALTSNAFARAGYTFAGWLGADSTTYPDGATVLNLTNAQDAVVTLVAQWRVNIPYIDADGNERICADYTVLTSAAGDVVYGAGGATAWYVVTNAVTISGKLRFCDDTAHLILCDGATLAVTNAYYAIEACNLAIYGQADSTGAVVGNGMHGIFCGGSVTINGGTVTAAAADDSGCGIWASSLTINGGTVTAEGNSYGIVVQNDITLGWTKPNDSITASSYTSFNGGAVYVKSRKYLTDGVEVYSGKLDDSQVAAIAGATLRPGAPPPLAYVDADGVERQCLDYVVIASGSDAATLGYAGEETWYAVTNNASISGGLKFLDKYAHIIVADGATLTVVNQDGDAVYAQKDLVVYGQSAGTGKLVAIGGDNGVYVEEGLVINHVIVNATGNDEYGIYSWGWAIGDGEVVINGATVTAEGGECGFFTYDGLIINGGSLSASGDIGIHTDYTLTLNDGQIEAIGDTHGIQSDEWLVANGGSVYAVGEDDSGISAYNGIKVNDGTITAEGGKNGLYVEFALFVNGGRVNATGGNCGVYAENGDITVVGGNTSFIATRENRHGICAEEGDIILGWTNPTDSITLNGCCCYSEEGGVYVKKGRVLTDGADLYEGKIDLDDVASKTLRPYFSWESLQKHLDAGGTVVLPLDVTSADGDATLVVTNTVTLDLAGHTIDADGLFGVIEVREGGNLTLTNSIPESGAVTGGQADYGGGVYVDYGGAFTMTGGEISGNMTDYAGGVYVDDGGTFTMIGGEISGNTAWQGGGVYVCYGGTFTMTGGEISDNTAYYYGGGVYVCDDHSFTVSGSPVITGNTDGAGAANNVYLCGVMVVGELAESASIGVSVEEWITPSRPFRFTNGASAEDAKFFFSDNTKRFVEAGADGELFVKLPFTPWAALQALLDGGGVVTLTNSVVAMSYDGSLVVTNTVLLDLAGHTIDAAGWFCAIDIAEGGNLTLTNSVEGVGAITGGNTGVGIYDGGRFTMTAGAVSGNHYGGEGGAGGVNVHHGGTFTMTGGEIFGNFAAAGGGGVDVDGTFTMTGGTIKDNISDEGACGVEVGKYGLMEVSGRAVISGNTNCFGTANNVYLGDAATIVVVGDLEDGAYIGVTTDSKPMPGNPVTIATGAAAGDDRHFHSDLGIASVAMVDGEVCLVRSSYTQWETLQSRLDAGGVVALADDVVATDGDETLTVTNTVTLDLAGHTIDAAGRIGIIEILDGGDLTLTNSAEVTGAITGVFYYNQNVVYVGDGGTFTMTGGEISGNTADCGGVYVGDGGAFTMTGGEISGNTANYVGGVYVDRYSTFTMTGGEISGNAAGYGGGVCVDSDGSFEMTGGKISGNCSRRGGGVYVIGLMTVSGDSVVSGNTNTLGSANNVWLGVDKTIAVSNLAEGARIGVATEEPPTLERSVTITSGAAEGDSQYFFSDDSVNCTVVVAEGELHLMMTHSTQWEALQARLDEGGTVALTEDVVATLVDTYLVVTNTVLLDLNGHSLVGNGVYMVLAVEEGGELTLTNSVEGVGAIRGGYYREASGGGVYVDYGGAFTMTGGEISGNMTDYAGGGVYVNDGGTFTMTGGEISGNTADCYGGGVYVDNDGTFTMTGGEISGNTADYCGGGVYVRRTGKFTVSGSPVVSGNANLEVGVDNVYFEESYAIVAGGLEPGASIGVTTETTPTSVEPVTFATGAAKGDEAYFFSDNPGCHVERSGDELRLAGGAISPSFTDPEGRVIADTALVDWLMANDFTQSDINALGNDSAGTDKLYECWVLNCSITAVNPGGALSLAAIAVGTNEVSVTVQLVRRSPLGAINGELHLYGADDLSVGFGDNPIAGKSIDFGDGDSTFDTDKVLGPLTQSVTAVFSTADVTCKFFKAKIDFPIREGQEEE